MVEIGTVKSLWRYPIKGMAGESMNAAEITAMGIHGDRVMAVQDIAREEIQSCKFRPNLLQCRATYLNIDDISQGIQIQYPDGENLSLDDKLTNKKISDLIGHESKVQTLRPASDQDFYRRHKTNDHTWLEELKATFEREPGEPLPDLDNMPEDSQNYVSILGSFFLVSPFHIISTATLNYLSKLNPNANWDEERFRPNLVIETFDDIHGLAEQAWLNQTLKIGDVTIQCTEGAPRCGAVVRKQQHIEADNSVLRTIVREADQNLGIYGDVTTQGTIYVGDSVYLCEAEIA